MKAAVIRFPGSNCDQDCVQVLREVFGADAHYVWHKDASVDPFDLIVLPGGFSYGDYLRCGAIARFSPVMKSVIENAGKGKPVIGICNGFQILCEAGLLPGALIRNRSLHFVCEHVGIRVETAGTPFTANAKVGDVLRIPVAHGEGNYTAEPDVLRELTRENRVVFRYADPDGNPTDAANPNGSTDNIAGICNAARNVVGMMPHPERACDPLLGSTDGRVVFQSVLDQLGFKRS